jgi:hypothetical protein
MTPSRFMIQVTLLAGTTIIRLSPIGLISRDSLIPAVTGPSFMNQPTAGQAVYAFGSATAPSSCFPRSWPWPHGVENPHLKGDRL